MAASRRQNLHARKNNSFLACLFCFPISDNIMMPQRTFSFKCCFMHVNPRAYVCLENITWSELGKQSMQAKKVYSASYAGKTLVGHLKNIFYTKLAFFHFKYVYIFKKNFFLSFLNVFLQEEHFHLLSVVLNMALMSDLISVLLRIQ